MSHESSVVFVDVYDTRTRQKLPHQVPEAHLELFPYLSRTPSEQKGDQRPTRSASKTDWVAYAVTQGMAVEDAEALTRDDLVNHYTQEG